MQYTDWILATLLLLAAGCAGSLDHGDETARPSPATRTVPADSLVLVPEKGIVLWRGQPFSGTAQKRYPNGQLAASIQYADGKKHGTCLMWFEDGTKSFEATYVNGKRHGKVYTWWRNGNLRSESNYVMGVAQGEQKQWHSSGAIFKKIHLVDGREEGLQQCWRENGKLYSNYEARNGRTFGLKRSKLCYELDDEIVDTGADE